MKFFRAWLLITAITSFAQAAFAGTTIPNVLVTTEPLTPYVNELLEGITEAKSLLKPGQDPHHAALSPSQALALKEADVIIMPAASMSPELARLIDKKKAKGALVIELVKLEGANALPYPDENPWLEALKEEGQEDTAHDHDHTHHHDVTDPHLWLDPLRMAAIASSLAEAIAIQSPMHRATLNRNALALSTHLKTVVHPALAAMLKAKPESPQFENKPYIPFITYHAAYQYFLKRYGLQDGGFITGTTEGSVGAKTRHETMKKAESIALGCLIAEHEGAVVKRIARDTGARLVALNPERRYSVQEVVSLSWIRNDYDRLLYKVASSFSGCLN